MSRIINKLIRKISGSELAQKQNASIIKNGKPNEITFKRVLVHILYKK